MDRAALFPFFGELSSGGQSELHALAATRAPARKLLLRRGDPTNGAYLVLEGALRVYYITHEGREATLYRVERGATCVLALSSTLREQPYPAWVQATTRGALFVRVPQALFERLLRDEPAFRHFVLNALSERIHELMCALEQLATATLEQRIATLLLERAAPELAITQAALAAELGTVREVVSRVMRELVRRGVVMSTRGRIRVIDRAGLARISAPHSSGPPP